MTYTLGRDDNGSGSHVLQIVKSNQPYPRKATSKEEYCFMKSLIISINHYLKI